jgi:hypothetical protein
MSKFVDRGARYEYESWCNFFEKQFTDELDNAKE